MSRYQVWEMGVLLEEVDVLTDEHLGLCALADATGDIGDGCASIVDTTTGRTLDTHDVRRILAVEV